MIIDTQTQQKTISWILAKGLGVTVLIATNIVFGYQIIQLWNKIERIEVKYDNQVNQTFNKLDQSLNKNTEVLVRVNDKLK